MRNNQPVNARETRLGVSEFLISTTDSRGVITDANKAFCRAAGFGLDELLGQAHNLVRHPDMPSEAFGELWRTLKGGKPWMGVVKNRCKDGGYYWVDAFVTPINNDKGELNEYQSVRTCLMPEVRARAESVYEKLKSPQKKWSQPSLLLWQKVTLLLLMVATPGFFSVHWALQLATLCFSVFWAWRWYQPLAAAVRLAKGVIDDPLAQYIYTGDRSETGSLMLAQMMLRRQLRATVARIHDGNHQVSMVAQQAANSHSKTCDSVDEQAKHLDQVANAMDEMVMAVQSVSSQTSFASQAVDNIRSLLGQGEVKMATVGNVVGEVSEQVDDLNNHMQQLQSDSTQIGSVLDMIVSIAEQTNLLALNAAIESARAGEHGRGFAVVADEVRALSQKTQASTRDIQEIVTQFQRTLEQTREALDHSRKLSGNVRRTLQHTIEAFSSINGDADRVGDVTREVATALEQQLMASEDINSSLNLVRDAAEQLARLSLNSKDQVDDFVGQSQQQQHLAAHFLSA